MHTGPEPSTGETGGGAATEEEEDHDGEAMSEDDWRSMSGFLDPYLPEIVSAFDLGGLHVAYDLGGTACLSMSPSDRAHYVHTDLSRITAQLWEIPIFSTSRWRNNLKEKYTIFSRQASLARQAFLITPLHGARYKTGKNAIAKK